MKLLPFENITYRSRHDSEEILRMLGEIIEPKKVFRMTGIFSSTSNHKPYEGIVNGNTFSINRIINYQNSFLPRINGTVEKDFRGTKINVKMRLPIFATVFMIVWFGGVGKCCLAFLPLLLNIENSEPMALIPFGMLLFGYVLVTGGFKFECIRSKKYLAQFLEADIEE